MSRTKTHPHCLIGLCLLAAAFALTATIAIPAASADQGTKHDPPSLLWKSYPLDRRPSTTVQEEQIRRGQASGQTSADQDHFLTPVLVSAFTLLLAAAAIALMRRSAPVRVGNARRTPDRAPMARSVQPASVDRPGWGPRRPLQLREVIPEVVKEPHTPAPHAPASQSDAELLEALQPKPNPPRPEPTTDLPVVDVDKARPGRTPEPVDEGPPAKQPPRRETGDLLVEEREAPEPLTEALDHLLGVLDFRSEQELDSRFQPTWEVTGAAEGSSAGPIGAMITFRRRLRRSRRLRYRVPRLVITWISLGLAVICVTWLLLSVTGSR
jgi:hypothetical protein